MPTCYHAHGALLRRQHRVWGGTGFNMIVIYTALRAVPTELYERRGSTGVAGPGRAVDQDPDDRAALVLTGSSPSSHLQVFNEPQTLYPLTNTISRTGCR